MRTQEIKVYKFEELSDKAKDKAHDYFMEHWLNSEDYADLDYFQSMLEEKGFRDPKINYSGFWSQGDGASFTCDFIDIEAYFKAYGLMNKDKNHKMFLAAWKRDWVESVKIYRISSRYYHENTIDISWSCNFRKQRAVWIEKIFANIVQDILNDAKDLSREIYKGLEEQYEYATSYEYIQQVFDGNDIEFYEDGRIFR